MTPYKHAESSAARWGGLSTDYIDLHEWLDETKAFTGDWTHRALRHHSAGVQWAVNQFGHVIINSELKHVPVKQLAEQHVIEDCGFIPTPQDWLKGLQKHPEDWMLKVKTKSTTELKKEE